MRDYLSVGSSPAGEECVQVGCENYRNLARKECQRFIDGIRSYLGKEPKYARLYIKSNPHDFGTYLEVNCENEEDDKEPIEGGRITNSFLDNNNFSSEERDPIEDGIEINRLAYKSRFLSDSKLPIESGNFFK